MKIISQELKSHLQQRAKHLFIFFFGYFTALTFITLIAQHNGSYFSEESVYQLVITFDYCWVFSGPFLFYSVIFYILVGFIRFRFFPKSYDVEGKFITRPLYNVFSKLL